MSSLLIEAAPIHTRTPESVTATATDVYELLVGVTSPDRELDSDAFDGVDWDALLRHASHHSLVPLLAHRVLDSNNCSLPAYIRARLRTEFQRNLFRNLGLLEELKRILALWKELDIEAIPYKGPVLAEQLWGSFALRECSDLDLLVRRGDVERAGQELLTLDYDRVSPVASSLCSALLRNASEEQFRNSRNNIFLELQWAPAPRTLAVKYDDQRLWRNLTTVEVSGTRVHAPGPEDLVALLTIHGWKHNWSKLIWVADLAAAVRLGNIDWKLVQRTAEFGGWRRILLLGLEMVRRVYSLETPLAVDPGVRALARDLEQNLRAARNVSYAQWHRGMLRARDRCAHQAQQLAYFIFTPGLAEYASIDLPRWAASGYRLVRLARVLRLSREKALE